MPVSQMVGVAADCDAHNAQKRPKTSAILANKGRKAVTVKINEVPIHACKSRRPKDDAICGCAVAVIVWSNV